MVMKLKHACTTMDLDSHPLSEREMQAANLIANALRDDVIEGKVGLYIWRVCKAYEVDHHRVARHLGSRNRMRKPA